MIVCSFQSAPDVTRRTTYAELRAAVLAAGRFSVFEATASARAARLYDQLIADPTVKKFRRGFPWIGVRERNLPVDPLFPRSPAPRLPSEVER